MRNVLDSLSSVPKPLLGLLAVCIVAGVFLMGRLSISGGPHDSQHAAAQDSGEGTLYVCPMNDVPPLPAPGDCPVCGMELVPLAPEDQGHAARITLNPEQMRRAGIRLAPAKREFITADIRMFGSIEYDPGYFTRVDAFTNGVIEKVYVRRTGEFIRQNDKLFDFFSAEIYEMELELLEIARQIPNYIKGQLGETLPQSMQGLQGGYRHPALQGRPGRPGRPQQSSVPKSLGPAPSEAPETADAGGNLQRAIELQRRFAAIRFRLRSYGLYDQDINEILRLERPVGIIPVRIPTLTSTVGGVVIENEAFQGRYVNAGTPLMTIADPHFVWARLKAFEADYMWLRTGQHVEFTTEARPGEVFKGKITQIDPVFDSTTRTFDVGVVYFDDTRKLRPSMLVRATVRPRLTEDGRPAREDTSIDKAPLVVPASAPLITGKRAVIYVAVPGEPGAFEGRVVTLGLRTKDHYIVRQGLSEGEMVVVSGNFKLDSELQLRAQPSMMNQQGMPGAAQGVPMDMDALAPGINHQEMESTGGKRPVHVPELDQDSVKPASPEASSGAPAHAPGAIPATAPESAPRQPKGQPEDMPEDVPDALKGMSEEQIQGLSNEELFRLLAPGQPLPSQQGAGK